MTDFDELKQTKAQCLRDITEALPNYLRQCQPRQPIIERIFLKYLNLLLDYLADIEIIDYLCIVKIIRGARSSSTIKMKAAYFVPYAKRTIAATA